MSLSAPGCSFVSSTSLAAPRHRLRSSVRRRSRERIQKWTSHLLQRTPMLASTLFAAPTAVCGSVRCTKKCVRTCEGSVGGAPGEPGYDMPLCAQTCRYAMRWPPLLPFPPAFIIHKHALQPLHPTHTPTPLTPGLPAPVPPPVASPLSPLRQPRPQS